MQAADARRLAAVYFLVQAAAVPVWWMLLFAVESSRVWFLPSLELNPVFVALVAPDFAILSLGSAIAGLLALRDHPIARVTSWIMVGAVTYATVYTLAWTVLTDAPALAACLMVAASTGSIVSARVLGD